MDYALLVKHNIFNLITIKARGSAKPKMSGFCTLIASTEKLPVVVQAGDE